MSLNHCHLLGILGTARAFKSRISLDRVDKVASGWHWAAPPVTAYQWSFMWTHGNINWRSLLNSDTKCELNCARASEEKFTKIDPRTASKLCAREKLQVYRGTFFVFCATFSRCESFEFLSAKLCKSKAPIFSLRKLSSFHFHFLRTISCVYQSLSRCPNLWNFQAAKGLARLIPPRNSFPCKYLASSGRNRDFKFFFRW